MFSKKPNKANSRYTEPMGKMKTETCSWLITKLEIQLFKYL